MYERHVEIYASIANGMSTKQWDKLLDDGIKFFKIYTTEKGGADFTDVDVDGDTDEDLDDDDVSPHGLAALEADSDMDE